MDIQTRSYYFKQFNPEDPLNPEDPRNLDIDSYNDGEIRGDNWSEDIWDTIRLSHPNPVVMNITGLPGSGKSTEIRRLTQKLRDREESRLFPVLVEAKELLNLTVPLGIPEVLMAIIYAVEREVLIEEGEKPEDAMKKGYFSRFWSWMSQTDISIQSGGVNIPGVTEIVYELKTRADLRDRVRKHVDENLITFLEQIREELTSLNKRVKSSGRYNGIVVIVDSLEKLKGTSTSFYDVLNSAETFFQPGSPWLEMPIHIVYTVPPALRTKLSDIDLMPMLKIRTRQGEPYLPGLNIARELIRRRIADNHLKELLGEDCEKRVQQIILWSGGYPRELVKLFQRCLQIRSLPASEKNFQRLFSELKEEYRTRIMAEDFPWLATVAHTHFLTTQNPQHLISADRMLSINAVLRYKNDEGWYELHPAVYEIPGVQDAIKKLKAEHDPKGG